MDYSRPEMVERLAADYAIGTLRGGARRRFEALLPAHPALRQAARAWEARLLPLTLPLVGEQPSARVWQRVRERIGSVVPATTPWWDLLSLWRGWAALATIGLAALAVVDGLPDAARPPIVVVLSAATPDPAAGPIVPAFFVASISADGRAAVTRPLVAVGVQPDHVLELWALPASGGPRSLGLIDAKAATVVHKNKLLDGTTALAVSLEPTGGSTTGAPTGPVLYVGKLPPT